VVALIGAVVVIAASFAAAASGRTSAKSISVAIVANPQMQDIASLTPSLFTAKSGIKVNYTILDEGKLREITTRDVGSGGKAFDAVMIGPYEAPQFGVAGLIQNLTPAAKADKSYNYSDLIPAVRNALSANGHLYASPFYGESSFLMYRKDILAKAGLKMPLHPTWQQVAAIAKKLNTSSMSGICLRGKPGWGDLGAAFTTVLNTWGGTWWSAKPNGQPDKAQVDQPAFKSALDFYAGLVKAAGEPDAANSSFNECLAAYQAGKVAMWYDATVAAGLLEAKDSPVRGKNGFAFALTRDSLDRVALDVALAIPKAHARSTDAWKYIVGDERPIHQGGGTHTRGSWPSVPPGTRFSTYRRRGTRRPGSRSRASRWRHEDRPDHPPGTTKRPGLPGVQYVGIPQFQDVGNRCTQLFSAVIAGSMKDTDALSQCQQIASQAIK
jgi:sorbitol/mannitol transport system substrate-binding protein